MTDPNLTSVLQLVEELLASARQEERDRCVDFVRTFYGPYDDEDGSLSNVGAQLAMELARVDWR